MHLGWENYGKPRDDGGEKIRCFARFGGFVDRTALAQASFADRLYYRVLGPVWRSVWGLVVAWHWFTYILRHFPRGLNELQAQARVPNTVAASRKRCPEDATSIIAD